MAIKTKRIGSDSLRADLSKVEVENPDFVEGNSATYIPSGSILSLTGIGTGHLQVSKAQEGFDEEDLMVAMHEIRDWGIAASWAVITADTSGQAAKDPVYLSSATSGGIKFTGGAGTIRIGKVLTVATEGKVLIKL